MVASRKNARMVASESSLEQDMLVLLEFDPAVELYEEQPVRIEYADAEGGRHTYTPDVLVRFRAELLPSRPPLLCEVKYRDELFSNWKEIKPGIRAGRSHAREQGWRFKILTERKIRTPYLENAKFLRPYRNEPADEANVRLLLDTLKEVGETSPEQLLSRIHQDPYRRAELLPTLWQLVSNGVIGADLNKPLTMCSVLWEHTSAVGGGNSHEHFLRQPRAWRDGRVRRPPL